MGNGLRLVSAGRKSRKGDEDTQFARQEARNAERAERDGHTIVHTTRDVVSSQTMPWDRRDLKAWMTEPTKLAMYDGILVEADRLSRCDDEGWHYIEHWCYVNSKRIVTTEGVQFPARDDSDRYQWIGLKRRARTYWEDVRDKHAQTRELVKANGGAIGMAPLGYVITGPKLHKTFEIDPVYGPIVVEAFTRISNGATVISVASWLSGVLGRNLRSKFVTDMIGRTTYLGYRDHFTFEALITQELFESANAALAIRRFTHKPGGRAIAHAYSGLILCECGAPYYHHQSTAKGKAVGKAKYRCGRGRSGQAQETRCEYGAPIFMDVNEAVDRLMTRLTMPEWVMTTTGGDHARQAALSALQDQMSEAMARKDMATVTRLAAEFEALDGQEPEPIEISVKQTGRTYSDAWAQGTLEDRRTLLERAEYRLTVKYTDDEWRVFLVPTEAGREAFKMFKARDWKIGMSEALTDY